MTFNYHYLHCQYKKISMSLNVEKRVFSEGPFFGSDKRIFFNRKDEKLLLLKYCSFHFLRFASPMVCKGYKTFEKHRGTFPEKNCNYGRAYIVLRRLWLWSPSIDSGRFHGFQNLAARVQVEHAMHLDAKDSEDPASTTYQWQLSQWPLVGCSLNTIYGVRSYIVLMSMTRENNSTSAQSYMLPLF